MAKDWKEITDDDLLNFDGAQTNIIARYERIMAKKTINSLMDVWAGLHDVKKTMHVVAGKLEDRLHEAEKIQKKAIESQSRLQGITVALTVVIALSTVAYTWITWESVQVQRAAINIQHQKQ